MVLEFIFRLIAHGIRRVNINRIQFDSANNIEVVRKSRTLFCSVLIALGNLAFKFRRVPLNVLYTSDWIQWERVVSKARSISDYRTDHLDFESSKPNKLVMKKLEGETLFDLLNNPTICEEEKLKATKLAFEALFKLHQLNVNLPGGCPETTKLSHGDASIKNVIYDCRHETASWFDFDLRHYSSCPVTERHADDLRSLLFTSALFFSDSIPILINLATANYPAPDIWIVLKSQLDHRWFWLDLFHQSQILRATPTAQLANSNKIGKEVIQQVSELLTNSHSLVGD